MLIKRDEVVYEVASAKDALDLLMSSTMDADGATYSEAIDACEAAVKGTGTNEVAQFAFLAAAMDNGFVVEFPD